MTMQNNIRSIRKATPCDFLDGISYERFRDIAYKEAKEFGRIKDVSVAGPVINCAVESQSGCSEWNFAVDFNNWGHIEGTYWLYTDNNDSNIPSHYGRAVSGTISNLLAQYSISLPDFSEYVDADDTIGTTERLFHWEKEHLLKKLFKRKKYVVVEMGVYSLKGEHLYPVFAVLKHSGFKKIVTIPIEDTDPNSSNYIFEVEQIVINGITDFDKGDSFAEDAVVAIHYHAKLKISIPVDVRSFKRKDYISTGDYLQALGFTKIYERKIRDLTTGWITKDGSVEQVLISVNGNEEPIQKNQPYEYDTEIIITYHTF